MSLCRRILWIPIAPALKVSHSFLATSTPPLSNGNLGSSVLIAAFPSQIPDLIDIGPAVGIEIAFNLDITTSINFTYGATGQVRILPTRLLCYFGLYLFLCSRFRAEHSLQSVSSTPLGALTPQLLQQGGKLPHLVLDLGEY